MKTDRPAKSKDKPKSTSTCMSCRGQGRIIKGFHASVCSKCGGYGKIYS